MIGFNILEIHKTYAAIAEAWCYIFSARCRREKHGAWKKDKLNAAYDIVRYTICYLMSFFLIYLLLLALFLFFDYAGGAQWPSK
jgi:hypothetical protein